MKVHLFHLPFSATATSHSTRLSRHRSQAQQNLSFHRKIGRLRGRVGVHLALAAGHDDVHEAAGVGDTLLRAALGDLLLLLLLDLCARKTLATGVLQRWL